MRDKYRVSSVKEWPTEHPNFDRDFLDALQKWLDEPGQRAEGQTMARLSFKQFLILADKRKVFGETPEGDFVKDSLRDSTFRDFTQWGELETYLRFRRACPEALAAAKIVFKKWKAAA